MSIDFVYLSFVYFCLEDEGVVKFFSSLFDEIFGFKVRYLE